MPVTVEFEHKISDQIVILALGCSGTVVGYYFGARGIQYDVSYFVDGIRHSEYLYPQEIRAKDFSDSGMGFKT